MTAAAAAAPDAIDDREASRAALLDKAREVTAKAAALRNEAIGARKLWHQAQVREALTRTELTLALTESLATRADLEARLRAQALAGFQARGEGRLRRYNRISRLIDRVLFRLGLLGQVIVIARSGLRDGETDTSLHRAWYLAKNPDVAASNAAPLAHYLVRGGREGRDPGPLFHAGWYARVNAQALAATGLTPLEHYARVGAAGGLSPHPLFDAAHYLAQAPTLAAGDTPVGHYLREGWRRGLSPHVLFDPAYYVEQTPDAANGPPLLHYLSEGWKAGLSPHPLFDVRWYIDQHVGVAEAGIEPLGHFLANGGFEGVSPSPWFDLPHYVEARGAGLAPGVHPLIDYLQGGAWAVTEARPGFPTAAYLATRPGLVSKGVTPLEHWARRGAH